MARAQNIRLAKRRLNSSRSRSRVSAHVSSPLCQACSGSVAISADSKAIDMPLPVKGGIIPQASPRAAIPSRDSCQPRRNPATPRKDSASTRAASIRFARTPRPPARQIPLKRLDSLTGKAGLQSEETADIDSFLLHLPQAHIAVGRKVHLEIRLRVRVRAHGTSAQSNGLLPAFSPRTKRARRPFAAFAASARRGLRRVPEIFLKVFHPTQIGRFRVRPVVEWRGFFGREKTTRSNDVSSHHRKGLRFPANQRCTAILR